MAIELRKTWNNKFDYLYPPSTQTQREMEAKAIMSPAWNPESEEAFVAVSADHDH